MEPTKARSILQEALTAVRRVKSRLVAEHGPDAPLVPQLEVWRNGQPIVLVSLHPDRQAIFEVMPFAICGFRATQVVLTFDGWHELHPINPDTGREWKPDEKQAYVETHGRDNGVVDESLTSSMWDATGGVGAAWVTYTPSISPLGIHRITWGTETVLVVGEDDVHSDDLLTDVALHGFQTLADAQDELDELTTFHQRATLGSDAELNAMLDAAAVGKLDGLPVLSALVLCHPDDTQRRAALEKALHRPMSETTEGAFEMDVKAKAARWN